MDVYLAGEHDVKNGRACQTWQGLNILESFVYARNNKYFPQLATTCERLMLDSGAFTLRKGKDVVDWEKYVDEYANFINVHNINLFIELDIDNIVGIRRVEMLRERLERATGKKCIPVWHPSRGKEYFIKMVNEYDYVALGGVVNARVSKKEYIKNFPWFIKTAHENGAKIHGLGFTSIPLLKVYKFDSVDSKAWVSGNLSGYIYQFNDGEMKKFSKDKSRLKSAQAARNNFYEWIKFSKWAKIHL